MNFLLFFALISQDSTPYIPPQEYKIHIAQPIRESNLGQKSLDDLERHMPENHIYRDNNKITWAHETTHGLNQHLTNKFAPNARCYYIYENRYVIVPKPNMSLLNLYGRIPDFVRRDTAVLLHYFQNNTWDNSEYILEEWVAYVNGCYARQDLKIESDDSEITFALMFNVYALYLSLYEDNQEVLAFIRFNSERLRYITYQNRNIGDLSQAYYFWQKVKYHDDYAKFREDIMKKHGEDWVKYRLGIR